MTIQIKTIQVTGFQQNARILMDSASKDAILVDPGGQVELIFDLSSKLNANISRIFLTHAHLDHGGGIAAAMRIWKERLGVTLKLLSCGEKEQMMRGSISQQAILFGFAARDFEDVPEPDLILNEGDSVGLGEYVGTVLETPGHAPGHLSLFFPEQEIQVDNYRPVTAPWLIAGDALFSGSIGRTDLPGGDHQTLIKSIKNKILVLPENTIVMPGHGPDTTVGIEKKSNPFLR